MKPTAQGLDEVITLLRQAWRHAEAAAYALEQARKHASSRDLWQAFVIQAAEQTKSSKATIETAAKTLFRLNTPQ